MLASRPLPADLRSLPRTDLTPDEGSPGFAPHQCRWNYLQPPTVMNNLHNYFLRLVGRRDPLKEPP